MRRDNMILILDQSVSNVHVGTTTMDASRQHMAGGRMATVPPTLPPASKTSRVEDVDVDRDNALNLAVRYHGQNINQNQKKIHSSRPQMTHHVEKRTTHQRSGHSDRRNGHHPDKRSGQADKWATCPDKRASLPVSLALSNTQGFPLVLKDSDLFSESGAGRSMLLCSQNNNDNGAWTLTPVVGLVVPGQLTVPRSKSSSSSTSSCSSSEECGPESPTPQKSRQTSQAPESPSHDVNMPLLPPRGPNCYENIPLPGIIRQGKKANSPPAKPPVTSSKDTISLYSRLSGYDSDRDLEKINRAIDRLGASGFFYETISASEAKAKLRAAQVGTFLIRVSSQTSHLFALSVKTSRGTTSIRLAYDNGNFRLDADPHSAAKMPAFECIIALVEYYVLQSSSDARNKCVFLESNGRRDTPVILTRPLREQPQGLKHICRRTLHHHHSPEALSQTLQTSPQPCSVQLGTYINSYPYAL